MQSSSNQKTAVRHFSTNYLLKRCGLSFPVVEMLPRSASWALHLQKEGEEDVEEEEEAKEEEMDEDKKNRVSDRGVVDEEEIMQETPVYQFSGKVAAKLPNSLMPSESLKGDATFTLFFWFRYED